MYRGLYPVDFDAAVALYGVDLCSEAKEVIKYCIDEGESRVVVDSEGNLKGAILAVNYDTLSEEMLCKLFCCSGLDDLPDFGTLHQALRNRFLVTYIVSLVGAPDELIHEFAYEYSKSYIVADPTSKDLYNRYIKEGFAGVELGAGRYYVCKGKGVVI